MAFGTRLCPDCKRRTSQPFKQTMSGRWVCSDCAASFFGAEVAGAITDSVPVSATVWAMLQRKVRRSRDRSA